ncbi:MAG: 6,7-dimethyl-8-ribityllumazine synthase [Paramuribaculum sp.]|nr:6,7-dimethyl-8-ribityllumazine synthase [Paramuribaculum sp.]
MSRNLPQSEILSLGKDVKIAIVTAEWNGRITDELERGARERLLASGVSDENIRTLKVPGAVELTFGAALAIERLHPDAVIVFGAVVRGDTPHFDYVCMSATQGVTSLNERGDVPVIFGVLTIDTEEQALERIGGRCGHKGVEAADTALRMIAFKRNLIAE